MLATVGIVGLAVVWSSSSPAPASAADPVAGTSAAVAVVAPGAGPSGVAFASVHLAAGLRQDPEGFAVPVAPLAIAWPATNSVLLTSETLGQGAAGVRFEQWSAPYDGSCAGVGWQLDGIGPLPATQAWTMLGLAQGRCYRWTVAGRDSTGSASIAASAAAARPWASGPSGWSAGEANHFWFPALGISQTVHDWPCPRAGKLANVVYQWDCAGTNNRYLMGHAYGVFRPLVVGYQNRIHVGQIAWVADAHGHLVRYRLTSVIVMLKKVAWKTGKWTFAATPTSVLTLQTCFGAANDRFLFIRFAPG